MASGRKSFQEEFSSALLAWLLNPHMEHGLGYSFLEAFITSIFKKVPTDNYKKAISEIIDKLKPALRTQKENTITFEIHLEKNVANAFIDIVVQLDNWWFAIENKIYSESVREKDHQVKTQYIGLRKTIDTEGNNTDHIVSVFLVPNTQSNAVYEEYESLNQSQLKDGDLKTIIVDR